MFHVPFLLCSSYVVLIFFTSFTSFLFCHIVTYCCLSCYVFMFILFCLSCFHLFTSFTSFLPCYIVTSCYVFYVTFLLSSCQVFYVLVISFTFFIHFFALLRRHVLSLTFILSYLLCCFHLLRCYVSEGLIFSFMLFSSCTSEPCFVFYVVASCNIFL